MEVQSNTTIAHNLHTLRFGGRLRRSATTDFAPSNFGGTFSFFGVTNAPVLDTDGQPVGDETAQITSLEQYRRTLLFTRLGYPASRIRSLGGGASQFSIAAGNPLVKFSQTDLGVYLNDEWRARPNLTITFGFRYETQTNIRDREISDLASRWHGRPAARAEIRRRRWYGWGRDCFTIASMLS